MVKKIAVRTEDVDNKVISLYLHKMPVDEISEVCGYSRRTIYRVLEENSIKKHITVQDLVGARFGNLLVLSLVSTKRHRIWLCKCDCGNIVERQTRTLTDPKYKSCGCVHAAKKIKHGMYKGGASQEAILLLKAQTRAKKKGIDFNIDLSDITIPEFCPILGIKLKQNKGARALDSATLDRTDNTLGYIRGNVSVISFRANVIKNDATLEELKKIYAWRIAEALKDGSEVFYSDGAYKKTSENNIVKPSYKLYKNAKHRAKTHNLSFELDYQKIVIPAVCPVLGIPLEFGKGVYTDNSPTIDRLIPSNGYTEKNSRIISWRANRIKNDASLAELQALVQWLDSQSK